MNHLDDNDIIDIVSSLQKGRPPSENPGIVGSWRDHLSQIRPDLRESLRQPGIIEAALACLKQVPEQELCRVRFQEEWQRYGYCLSAVGRHAEALVLYESLYERLLAIENASVGRHPNSTSTRKGQNMARRIGKGTCLISISHEYQYLGCPALALRFAALAACEDATARRGIIDPETGAYDMLVRVFGVPLGQLEAFFTKVFNRVRKDRSAARFPEWLLQEVSPSWAIGAPSSQEVNRLNRYVVSKPYVRYLMSKLWAKDGKALETLSGYLISAMPGARVAVREKTKSGSDLDLVCEVDASHTDFRQELGRYFICECKDWKRTVNLTHVLKFCRVLDSVKARFGILFSRRGISGEGTDHNSHHELQKLFQDRGIVIISIDRGDLEQVCDGHNLIDIIRRKYQNIRLDLNGKVPGVTRKLSAAHSRKKTQS